MENNTNNLIRQTMTYSAWLGLILIVLMALQSFTKLNSVGGVDFVVFFVLFAGVSYFMHRYKLGVESLSYGRSVLSGILILVFASLWITLYKTLEIRYAPDVLKSYIEFAMSQIQASTYSDVQKNAQLEVMKTYPGAIYISSILLYHFIFGIPVILVYGIFNRKQGQNSVDAIQ